MKTSTAFFALVAFGFFLQACNPVESKKKSRYKDDEEEETTEVNIDTRWKGKLITEYAGDLRYYDFESNEETTVFKEAGMPSVTEDGEVITTSSKFPAHANLIQVADPEFNNVKTLLDLHDGWIGGSLNGYEVSPDGRYIAVSLTSWSGYKIEKNGTYVFDKSGDIVAQFENKYQPDWTPDGRLVLTGAYIGASSDEKISTDKDGEQGIFLSGKDFSSLRRIDPGFDNPPPANAAVSPDGERVAFIKNNHVWVMDMDGENAHPLTASGGDNVESFPCWSPDGKFIACWSFKTFEKSYYTAAAIVPSNAKKPVKLTNDAPVWARDSEGDRVSGGSHRIAWVEE